MHMDTFFHMQSMQAFYGVKFSFDNLMDTVCFITYISLPMQVTNVQMEPTGMKIMMTLICKVYACVSTMV